MSTDPQELFASARMLDPKSRKALAQTMMAELPASDRKDVAKATMGFPWSMFPRREVSMLYTIIICIFAFCVVGSVLGIIWASLSGANASTLYAVLTTAAAFLTALFIPSPLANSAGSASSTTSTTSGAHAQANASQS